MFPSIMSVKADGYFVSCFFQGGNRESVVFIHGFGASKATFLDAFHFRGFQALTMVAPDLIGFGDSEKPSNFSYVMKDQAKILRKVFDTLCLDQLNLVTHSMGGIIGIELAEMIPNRISSFINVEGNITAEDCTMSRQVADMSTGYFAQEGFEQLKRSLAEESERNQNEILREYLEDFSKATPESLYKSSVSTVQESDSGDLLERFARLPMYKCYVYGEKNKGVFPAETKLRKMSIPLFYVSKSGHSMMKENVSEFYNLVLNAIHCGSRKCPSSVASTQVWQIG
jgi:pimeloyl-ACP methyl ester carboxylesterase